MDNAKKIEILDDLINRASEAGYKSGELEACIREIKTFIEKCMDNNKRVLDEINAIDYFPDMSVSGGSDFELRSCWESGKQTFISVLQSIKKEIALYVQDEIVSQKRNVTASRKVFIVHGHDGTMKLAVEKTLSQLGLTPIILHEQSNKGKTIIEKFEHYSADIGFAIVLLSPDDTVIVDGEEKARARQNVIFELGYFIAKLGRHNVVALYNNKDREIELPNDISGVIYEPYDNPDGAWRFNVVQELRASGYSVDANKLMK